MTRRKYCAALQEALQVRRAVPLGRWARLSLVRPERRPVSLKRPELRLEELPQARPGLRLVPREQPPVSSERPVPCPRVLRHAQWEQRLGAPALRLKVLSQA